MTCWLSGERSLPFGLLVKYAYSNQYLSCLLPMSIDIFRLRVGSFMLRNWPVNLSTSVYDWHGDDKPLVPIGPKLLQSSNKFHKLKVGMKILFFVLIVV